MNSEITASGTQPALLNRERAILEFNRRVLAQALRPDLPLLERLRYITIVSSNMDEFFEVRFADAIGAMRAAMKSPGAQADPQRIELARGRDADYKSISLKEVNALAKKYLAAENTLVVSIKPAE